MCCLSIDFHSDNGRFLSFITYGSFVCLFALDLLQDTPSFVIMLAIMRKVLMIMMTKRMIVIMIKMVTPTVRCSPCFVFHKTDL